MRQNYLNNIINNNNKISICYLTNTLCQGIERRDYTYTKNVSSHE